MYSKSLSGLYLWRDRNPETHRHTHPTPVCRDTDWATASIWHQHPTSHRERDPETAQWQNCGPAIHTLAADVREPTYPESSWSHTWPLFSLAECEDHAISAPLAPSSLTWAQFLSSIPVFLSLCLSLQLYLLRATQRLLLPSGPSQPRLLFFLLMHVVDPSLIKRHRIRSTLLMLPSTQSFNPNARTSEARSWIVCSGHYLNDLQYWWVMVRCLGLYRNVTLFSVVACA